MLGSFQKRVFALPKRFSNPFCNQQDDIILSSLILLFLPVAPPIPVERTALLINDNSERQ